MNTYRHFRLFLIIATWGFASGNSIAASNLSLETNNVVWQGGTSPGYNIFDAGEYPQVVFLTVRLTGDPCAFFVTFGPGGQGGTNRAATAAADTLTYEIYKSVSDRTILKDLPSATSNEVLIGSFGPDETELELSYAVVVPPLQVKPSGNYTDSFIVTLYEGTPSNYLEHDSQAVGLSVQVDEVTELSLVDSGSSFDPDSHSRALDFGELTTGEQQTFDLRVRSNAGYQVFLESTHGGALHHLDSQVTSSIPYSLAIGGTPVDLTAGQQVALTRTGRITDREGDGYPVEVTIGETAGAVAGTYRDDLTITVISNL